MNIREYFNNLYFNTNTEEEWEEVADYEISVFEMEEEEFEKWAKEKNIDLTAIGSNGITVLQYWAWDLDE